MTGHDSQQMVHEVGGEVRTSNTTVDYEGTVFACCLATVAGVAVGLTHSLDPLFGTLRRLLPSGSGTLLIGTIPPMIVVVGVFGKVLRGYRLTVVFALLVFSLARYAARYNPPAAGEGMALLGITLTLTYLVARLDQAKDTPPRSAVDAPLDNEREDILGRSGAVRNLELLASNPSVRCPRIALVGPVGSGKSTVINFVAGRLERRGHRVVRFNPWHHARATSIAESLVRVVEGALRSGGAVSAGFGLRYVASEVLAKWAWMSAFVAPSGHDMLSAKSQLGDILWSRLGPGRRLVIVVEDLERCSGQVVSDLLMRMHELIDADGLAYLFAFDRQRVEGVLQKEISADQTTLEKTLDYGCSSI